MTRADLAPCGDDEMIFKTNENLGGDTITYSLDHITTDGRIYHRESLADSDDPVDRKISVLGFGERFFRYQETWAIRQLMLKLNDHEVVVQRRAMDEILACFNFHLGLFSDRREKFLKNPSNRIVLQKLNREIGCYREGPAFLSSQEKPILTLQTMLSNTNIEECVRRNGTDSGMMNACAGFDGKKD